MEDADTIAAVSTPPGEGGISVIRMSGPVSLGILQNIFRPARDRADRAPNRTLCLGFIVNPLNSQEIDEVLAVYMPAPDTYTREDIVEIHSHGSFASQRAILDVITGQGARLAEPGEFTRRAFLNGRIDLVQAEAVLDIIRSETDEELAYALGYLKGRLSERIAGFKEVLKQALIAVEALIDFPEEDIHIDLTDHLAALDGVKKDIDRLISSYYDGRGIRDGYNVVIAGRTNAGKSSLLNALLEEERAIVTHLPGTTRDLIEEVLYLKGIKVRLIDTAGIRTPENIVEEEGIRRVRERLSEADLILWLIDGSREYSREDEDVLNDINQYNKIIILTKSDIFSKIDYNILNSKDIVIDMTVSAKDGIGIDDLKHLIFSRVTRSKKRDPVLITTVRHRDILTKVSSNISSILDGSREGMGPELVAFELHEALFHLGEITGETCPEDILDGIFSQFCIGK